MTTFTVREIVRHAGISLRTLRHYVAEKVVPAPEFRSSKTRYERAFLVRLRAAMTLRRRGLHLPAIREQLDQTAPEEMYRLAGYTMDPAEIAALGAGAGTGAGAASNAGAAGIAMRPLPAGFFGPHRGGANPPHERWEHFEVCAGVKLLVRTEADAEAWRVAKEMLALFAGNERPNRGG